MHRALHQGVSTAEASPQGHQEEQRAEGLPPSFASLDDSGAAAEGELVVAPSPSNRAPAAPTTPISKEGQVARLRQIPAQYEGLASKLEGVASEFAHFKDRVCVLEEVVGEVQKQQASQNSEGATILQMLDELRERTMAIEAKLDSWNDGWPEL